MDELEIKKRLYFKHRQKIPKEELVKRLGLKDWEVDYILGQGKYKKFEDNTRES